MLKLFAAGLFETFPGPKLIVGHIGELLSFWIDRIDDLEPFEMAGLGKIRACVESQYLDYVEWHFQYEDAGNGAQDYQNGEADVQHCFAVQ